MKTYFADLKKEIIDKMSHEESISLKRKISEN
jgi:hypothetical protein